MHSKSKTQQVHVLVQVGVPLMRLHEGKPHYTWLPLQKRTDKDNVSGEVHLRMQWISQELDTPADAALNLAVDVLLHGIGLSVVESSVKALPREVRSRLLCNGWHSLIKPWKCEHACLLVIQESLSSRAAQF